MTTTDITATTAATAPDDAPVPGPAGPLGGSLVTDPATRTATATWASDSLPLRGHYPGFPIVPGVFLVDAAARAATALGAGTRLTGLGRVRFLRPVGPGDLVEVHVDPPAADGDGVSVRCRLTVDGAPAASLTLRFDGPPGPRPSPAAEPVDHPTPGALDRDVRAVLPHRWPMLLVDRAVAVHPGDRLTAEKAVSAQEWVLADAPTTTPWPVALVLESWCQAAGVLAAWDVPNPDVLTGDVMLFAGLADVTFGRPVRPGDVLHHRVRLVRALDGAVVVTGAAYVDGQVALDVGSVSMALRPATDLRAATGGPR